MNNDKVLKSLQASQRWTDLDETTKTTETFSFTADVWLWSGGEAKGQNSGSWHFVTMPEDLGQTLKNSYGKTHASRNGLIKVEAQIGQTCWQTSLLWHNPTKSYLVALKAAVRKAEGVVAGEALTIKFKILPLGQ